MNALLDLLTEHRDLVIPVPVCAALAVSLAIPPARCARRVSAEHITRRRLAARGAAGRRLTDHLEVTS